MKAKPHLYPTVRNLALKLIADGWTGLSMDLLLNIIRWSPNGQKIGRIENEQYSLNNNSRAFLTRLFIFEFPQYKNLFDLRTATADEIHPKEYERLLEENKQGKLLLFT
jgi:hypothetical protein